MATMRMIPESAVSSPTAATRTRRLPPAATVPATTFAPASFVTACDSPVIIDSSTSADPSATTPSAGTRVPGRTRTTSPTASDARGTVSVPSAVTRSAVSGSSAASAASAPRAWAIERISSQWPRSMIVISDESSHQISTSNRPRVPAQLVTKATKIARLIRVIIAGWRSASSPALRAGTRGRRRGTRRCPGPAGSAHCPGTRGRCSRASARVGAPDHDRDRERQAQPELVAEHRDRVAGMAVVAAVVHPGGSAVPAGGPIILVVAVVAVGRPGRVAVTGAVLAPGLSGLVVLVAIDRGGDQRGSGPTTGRRTRPSIPLKSSGLQV